MSFGEASEVACYRGVFPLDAGSLRDEIGVDRDLLVTKVASLIAPDEPLFASTIDVAYSM